MAGLFRAAAKDGRARLRIKPHLGGPHTVVYGKSKQFHAFAISIKIIYQSV
ncbi:hypothetical protein PX554_02185 [Sphingomonas sp. H39-1-10]|uniref:hypothetical protein n=1 Tax=Sphingomonas TaxID=13687 RepID=UPI0015A21196|nr:MULTISPECIES: hypothetical protein [Sphingomonas]MDF0486924.1 hypothetical protein [Sphingomonas pollutisoli]